MGKFEIENLSAKSLGLAKYTCMDARDLLEGLGRIGVQNQKNMLLDSRHNKALILPNSL